MREADLLPFGELLDLIACYQIKVEDAKMARDMDDEEMIPDIP